MWKDIVIGNGDIGCSTIYFGYKGISHNTLGYRVSNAFIGISMTISKDSDVGKELTAKIAAKISEDDLAEFLVSVVLTHAGADLLRNKIRTAMSDAFDQGRAYQASEIRNVLSYSV